MSIRLGIVTRHLHWILTAKNRELNGSSSTAPRYWART